jgi:hypothetical protein
MRHPRIALLFGALLLAFGIPSQSANGAAGGPRVIAGHKTGPVGITDPPGLDVAQLPLPAGTWLLFAKATVVQGQDDLVNCTFDSQFQDDIASSVAVGVGNRQMAWAGFRDLAQPGDVALHCQAFGGATGTEISRIRIVAIKVGKVTYKQFDDPPTTFGSGKPVARVRSLDDDAAIPGSSLGTVVSLALPSGRWLAIYKTSIGDATAGGPPAIDCRLEVGNGRVGFRGDRALDEYANGDAGALAMLQTRELRSKGRVRVRCQATDVSEATFQRILALPAGTLVTGSLGRKTSSSGSGIPVIHSGSKSGPVDVPIGTTFVSLGRLRLPPGRWAILATAYARNQSGGAAGLLDCELTAGPDFDRLDDVELTGAAPHRRAPLVLAVVHAFGQKGTARLSCRSSGAPLDAYSIRMVAIRAGQLSDVDL